MRLLCLPLLLAIVATAVGASTAPTDSNGMASEAETLSAIGGTASLLSKIATFSAAGADRIAKCTSVSQAFRDTCGAMTVASCEAAKENEMCSSTHDTRPGNTSEARCTSMVGCVYIASHDHCDWGGSDPTDTQTGGSYYDGSYYSVWDLCCETLWDSCTWDNGVNVCNVKVATECDDTSSEARRAFAHLGEDDSSDCCDECAFEDPSSAAYGAVCVPETLQGPSVCGTLGNGTEVADTSVYFRDCSTGPTHEMTGADDECPEGICTYECNARVGDVAALHAEVSNTSSRSCIEQRTYGCYMASQGQSNCNNWTEFENLEEDPRFANDSAWAASAVAGSGCAAAFFDCICVCGADAVPTLGFLSSNMTTGSAVCTAAAGGLTGTYEPSIPYPVLGSAAERGYESMQEFIRAFVMNGPGVVNTAALSVAVVESDKDGFACEGTVLEPYTQGELTMTSGSAWVFAPTATATSNITVSGTASASIIGGSNAGLVAVSTPGKLRIADLVNTGQVTVTGGRDIFIAGVTNAGQIVVDNTNASIYNTSNSATGTVTFDGGNFYGYGIANSGTLLIRSGTGTVVLSSNTGSIEFMTGSSGSVTAPAGSTVTVPTDGTVTVVFTTPTPAPTYEDSAGERGVAEAPTAQPTAQPTAPAAVTFTIAADCSNMTAAEKANSEEATAVSFAGAAGLTRAAIASVAFVCNAGRRRAASIDVAITFASTVSASEASTAVTAVQTTGFSASLALSEGVQTVAVSGASISHTHAPTAQPTAISAVTPAAADTPAGGGVAVMLFAAAALWLA